MTRGNLLVGAFVAAFAAAAVPVNAQRSASSGTSTGESAVSRGGGDSGGSSSSGGSSASTDSGSSSTSSSGGAWSSPSNNEGSSRTRSEYYSAPTHPSERQQTRQRGDGEQRRGGSDNTGAARAVPRGDGGSAPGGTTTRGRSASADADQAPSRRGAPGYSRPRDGRTATGTAVGREFPRVAPGGGYDYPYSGYYGSSFYFSPYRRYYYVPAYGFGLGYLYDPYWYDPYSAGYGGYGYGGGYGGGAGYYGGSGSSSYGRGETGSLRLKIEPREAQVYVDGYFVGDVDNFDGLFQRLKIDAGGHRIEIRAEGYEPIQFDVLLVPGETVTYKGDLKRQ